MKIKSMIVSVILSALVLSLSAQAGETLKCKSFAGNWSRATIERLDDGSYTVEVKLWGKDPVLYAGEMEFERYRDRDEWDDSVYEEVYFSFNSSKLDGLAIEYVQTSDGADYLYLKDGVESSLSCR